MDLYEFDRGFFDEGTALLCGIDEAGRGPLAGPVVAAAVVLEKDVFLPGVTDSKKLSERKREDLYGVIMKNARAVTVGMADQDTIDRINILAATHMAAREALENLPVTPDLILTDYLKLKRAPAPVKALVKGDATSQAVAAASIIAKVTRDRLMMVHHERYPQYNFAGNKGYPTREHREALRKFGPCPLHRLTFNGVIKKTLF